jgi:TRAP-type C4-dicarboxylate transport system substrate-binding protein
MKKMTLSGALSLVALSVAFLMVPVMGIAAEKTIELKFATNYDQHRDHEKATFMFIDRVQKAAGDRIKFINKGQEGTTPLRFQRRMPSGLPRDSRGS